MRHFSYSLNVKDIQVLKIQIPHTISKLIKVIDQNKTLK